METAMERQGKSGNPNFTPAIGSNTTFDKRQPTRLQKSLGHHRKKTLRDLLNLTLQGKHKDITEARRLIADLIGCSEKEAEQFTFEEWINLTQIRRAALKSDAWKAVMERLYGAPTQTINERINIKVVLQPRINPGKAIEIKDFTVIDEPKEIDHV